MTPLKQGKEHRWKGRQRMAKVETQEERFKQENVKLKFDCTPASILCFLLLHLGDKGSCNFAANSEKTALLP